MGTVRFWLKQPLSHGAPRHWPKELCWIQISQGKIIVQIPKHRSQTINHNKAKHTKKFIKTPAGISFSYDTSLTPALLPHHERHVVCYEEQPRQILVQQQPSLPFRNHARWLIGEMSFPDSKIQTFNPTYIPPPSRVHLPTQISESLCMTIREPSRGRVGPPNCDRICKMSIFVVAL